jgi:hypothetical protein
VVASLPRRRALLPASLRSQSLEEKILHLREPSTDLRNAATCGSTLGGISLVRGWGGLVSNTRRDEGVDSEIKTSSNGINSKLTSSRSESKFSLSEAYCGAKGSGTGDRTGLGGFAWGSIRASGDDVSLESSLTIFMARTR